MMKTALAYAVRHPIRCTNTLVENPIEAVITVRERFIEHRERRRPPCAYVSDPEWESRLNEQLGMPWPSTASAEFWTLWPQVNGAMRACGLNIGPQSFAAWNDGDAALVRAAWRLARHLKPNVVLETGVAHGLTTRFLLEALERNGSGHLWSIDLPPQLYPELHGQIGAAVKPCLHHRWSYVKGSSRRQLPKLVSRLGQVDLFIHDSLHSERNVRFELDHVWSALTPGGAVLVDDIDANSAFDVFTRNLAKHQVLICEAEPITPDLRRANGKGLFGIIRKPPLEEPAR